MRHTNRTATREAARSHRAGYNSQYLRDHRQIRATRRIAAVRHLPTEAGVVPSTRDHWRRIASSVSHANRIMNVQTHRWVVRSMLVIRVSVTGIMLESVLNARCCSVAKEVAINKASGWHSVFKTLERAEVSEDENHSRSAEVRPAVAPSLQPAGRAAETGRSINLMSSMRRYEISFVT